MILVDRASKRFNAVAAVSALSFEVPSGCVCGFIGPNGAGKTTTIRMLAGAILPDSGRLFVGGADVVLESYEARRRLGYLPDNSPLPGELRVVEYLRFRCALWGVEPRLRRGAIDAAIDRCDLAGVRRSLISTLSRGMRQRLGLAATLVSAPRVIILDEPGTGLDPTTALSFRSLVRSLRGTHTVLFSSHNLAEVEATCDHLVLIDRGRLVAEGSSDALASAGAVAARYEIESTRSDASAIRALRGVRSVRCQTLDAAWIRTDVEVDPAARADRAIAEAIGEALAHSGAIVRRFERASTPLAEVFARLVGGSEHTPPDGESG